MDVAKTLRKPQNLMELKTYVSYMKDKSGITGWTDRQELLPVSENVLSCIMEVLVYSKSQCQCTVKSIFLFLES